MSTRLRRLVALAAVVALPLGTAACSDDTSDTDEPTEVDSGTDDTTEVDSGTDDTTETDDPGTDDTGEDTDAEG